MTPIGHIFLPANCFLKCHGAILCFCHDCGSLVGSWRKIGVNLVDSIRKLQ